VAVLINVTKRILLSPFIGVCVDCKRSVVQFVTAYSDSVHSLNQRRRTQKYCFAGPEVKFSLEHNTGRRENNVFLNLTLEEEKVMFIRDTADGGHSKAVAGTGRLEWGSAS
jgi:hypothetical protein